MTFIIAYFILNNGSFLTNFEFVSVTNTGLNYYVYFDKVKVATNYDVIVYNSENNGKMLLTGVEATQNLNSESFANYCEFLASGLLSSNIYKEYLFLTEICQSDLPYPLLYAVVRGN